MRNQEEIAQSLLAAADERRRREESLSGTVHAAQVRAPPPFSTSAPCLPFQLPSPGARKIAARPLKAARRTRCSVRADGAAAQGAREGRGRLPQSRRSHGQARRFRLSHWHTALRAWACAEHIAHLRPRQAALGFYVPGAPA